jgi:hypothetical protein
MTFTVFIPLVLSFIVALVKYFTYQVPASATSDFDANTDKLKTTALWFLGSLLLLYVIYFVLENTVFKSGGPIMRQMTAGSPYGYRTGTPTNRFMFNAPEYDVDIL